MAGRPAGDVQRRGDQAVGAVPGGRLLADRVGDELTGVNTELVDLPVPARVQPSLELRAVDLGVELEREVPAEAEGLQARLVAGQHPRRRGRQAAVAVELQPGPGRDQ